MCGSVICRSRVGATTSSDSTTGTLMDRSLFVDGTGISDSNTPFHDDLPIAPVGGTAAGLRGGRHIRYPGTPLANLWQTVLGKMGIPVD